MLTPSRYLTPMYRSIIHDDNPIPVRIYVVQRGDEIFDKGIVCSGIHGPRINFTSNIAIQSHRREDTEVGMILKLNRIRDNAAFGSPTMGTCPGTRIDA